ncbi:hypothetical protein [Kitasatospora sp. NPDC057223]|uniref:hypothetical protein n=1 Tax=Kitasatospora sp. NPDC057223 TaxID=3346055 RepID=UPI0036364A36
MRTYATADDALAYEGPGLADFVTPDELNQLIDGTLAPATITTRYIEHITTQTNYTVTDDADAMHADLLGFIRTEIDIAIGHREQEALDAATQKTLDELREHERASLHKKMELIAAARSRTASKGAIANALGISRPTLDKMLKDQEYRALFNNAIEYLTKPGTDLAEYREVLDQLLGEDWVNRYNNLLGIREVRAQAVALVEALTVVSDLVGLELSEERTTLFANALAAAKELAA